MTEAVKAIYQFLSGFGVPVYDENSVPEKGAVFPYITFTPTITDWDESTSMMVRLWDFPGPDNSAARLYSLVDKISQEMESGQILQAGKRHYVMLGKGEPWAQPQPTPEIKARVIILNFEVSTLI